MRIPTPEEPDDGQLEVEGTPGERAPQAVSSSASMLGGPRTATGTPLELRRPHRRNAVEEAIESGEIVERRSLVIRSQQVPAAPEWSDDPTEIAATKLPMPTVPSRRRVWLVAAIVCGLVAVPLLVASKPGPADTASLEASAQMIGTLLVSEARATLKKAEVIATSPTLRAAIQTDASSLADMARDHDLVFPLQPGDVVEVFQRGDAVRSLMLRLPAGAATLAPPASGQTRFATSAGGLVVLATAPVVSQEDRVAGEVVFSTPVDLAPLSARVAERADGAVLEGLGAPVVLVVGDAGPGVRLPIATKLPGAGPLTLAAVVPRPALPRAYAWACVAVSLLLLSIYAITTLLARRVPAT